MMASKAPSTPDCRFVFLKRPRLSKLRSFFGKAKESSDRDLHEIVDHAIIAAGDDVGGTGDQLGIE